MPPDEAPRSKVEPTLAVYRGVSFEEILEWSRSGGAKLNRHMQAALLAFTRSHRVRAHVAAAAAARRLVDVLVRQRAANDELERRLFDGRRLDHMKTSDLTGLYAVSVNREKHALDAALKHAQGSHTPVLPDDDAAALAEYEGPPPAVDANDPNMVEVLRAIAKANQFMLQQRTVVVPRPPRVQ